MRSKEHIDDKKSGIIEKQLENESVEQSPIHSPLKILMLTGHIYSSKRKAGFHHLAKALMDKDNHVTFCTIPNSLLEVVDCAINVIFESKDIYTIKNQFSSFFHSAFPKKQGKLVETSYVSLVSNIQKSKSKLKFVYIFNDIVNIDRLLRNIFMHGYCKMFSENYDVIIFESTNGLLLFDHLKKRIPTATFIYRVSDDLEVVNGIQEVIQYEREILPKFNLISSPSSQITEKLQSKSPVANIITQYHGIEKTLFDKNYPNPYIGDSKNLVFVGSGFMDETFLKIVSEINQNWKFHIIGNLPQPVESANIKYYGEMPFNETIPYLKFADCGLQTRSYSPGIETLEKSVKFVQYTYLKLPIIAPIYMGLKEPHVFSYEHNLESIEKAICEALSFDRESVDRSWVRSWNDIALELLRCIEYS